MRLESDHPGSISTDRKESLAKTSIIPKYILHNTYNLVSNVIYSYESRRDVHAPVLHMDGSNLCHWPCRNGRDEETMHGAALHVRKKRDGGRYPCKEGYTKRKLK